jgi:hypothetical protein
VTPTMLFNHHRSCTTGRPSARHVLLLLLGLTSACSDGSTEVTNAPVELTVARTEFTSITDSALLQVKVNGATATGVSIEVASEARVIATLPVLTAAALARQWIVPAAPGTVTLRVRAGAATPSTITIRVAPDRPTVLAATTTTRGAASDTATITGVLLDQIGAGALRVQGTPVELLTRTPTSARFVLSVQVRCASRVRRWNS